MSHKKIWLAIREIEDQAARDRKLFIERVRFVVNTIEMHNRARKKDHVALAERVDTLEKVRPDALKSLEFNWDALARALKAHVAGEIAGTNEPLTASVYRLADYIANEIPEVPGLICSDAPDTAIRLMGRYREALRKIEEKSGSSTPAQYRDVVETYRIARNALKGG